MGDPSWTLELAAHLWPTSEWATNRKLNPLLYTARVRTDLFVETPVHSERHKPE
jgi:hypothetical protein